MPDESAPEPGRPSKSERKREHQRLQALTAALAELSQKARSTLPISETFSEELAHCAQMSASGARQRQLRRLAHLLEHEDVDALRKALEQAHQPNRQQSDNLHKLEAMREQLLTEGETAISALASTYPDLNLKQLRSLVRDAKQEKASGSPRGAGRKLFRFLRASSSNTSG